MGLQQEMLRVEAFHDVGRSASDTSASFPPDQQSSECLPKLPEEPPGPLLGTHQAKTGTIDERRQHHYAGSPELGQCLTSDAESENDVYVAGAALKHYPAKSQEGTPENQIAGGCDVGERAAERSRAVSFAGPNHLHTAALAACSMNWVRYFVKVPAADTH